MARRLQPFDGDYERLRRVVARAWRASYRGKTTVFDYTIPYLRWNLEVPGRDPELLLCALDDGDLVGFFAGLPRTLAVRGRPGARTFLASFLSVDPAAGRRGVGADLAAGLLAERGPARGYAASTYFVDRAFSGSDRLLRRSAAESADRYSRERVGTTTFWLKIFDAARMAAHDPALRGYERAILRRREAIRPPPECDGKIRDFDAATDLDACLALLDSLRGVVDVARDWRREELAWQLDGEISRTLVYEKDGRVLGLVNYHLAPLYGQPVENELLSIIDNVYWRDLLPREREALLAAALLRLRDAHGALGVFLLDYPYYGETAAPSRGRGYNDLPFGLKLVRDYAVQAEIRRAGFLPWTRPMDHYALHYQPDSGLRGAHSFYVDFR